MAGRRFALPCGLRRFAVSQYNTMPENRLRLHLAWPKDSPVPKVHRFDVVFPDLITGSAARSVTPGRVSLQLMLVVKLVACFCHQACSGNGVCGVALEKRFADLLRYTPASWKPQFGDANREFARECDNQEDFFHCCFRIAESSCSLSARIPPSSLEIHIHGKGPGLITESRQYKVVAEIADASIRFLDQKKDARDECATELEALRKKWHALIDELSSSQAVTPRESSDVATKLHQLLTEELRGDILQGKAGVANLVFAPPGFLVDEVVEHIQRHLSNERLWLTGDAETFGDNVESCFEVIYEGLRDSRMIELPRLKEIETLSYASRCQTLIDRWNHPQLPVLVVRNFDAYSIRTGGETPRKLLARLVGLKCILIFVHFLPFHWVIDVIGSAGSALRYRDVLSPLCDGFPAWYDECAKGLDAPERNYCEELAEKHPAAVLELIAAVHRNKRTGKPGFKELKRILENTAAAIHQRTAEEIWRRIPCDRKEALRLCAAPHDVGKTQSLVAETIRHLKNVRVLKAGDGGIGPYVNDWGNFWREQDP